MRDPKNGNNNLLCNVLSDTPCNSIAIFSWKLTLTQIDVSRNRLAKKREMHTTFAPRVWDQVQVRGQSTNYPADLKDGQNSIKCSSTEYFQVCFI